MRDRRLLGPALLCLAFLLAAAPATSQQRMRMQAAAPERTDLRVAVDTIPITRFGNRPVVEVRINGRGPYPFILDTGAGGTVMQDSLAAELGLPVVGEARVRDPVNPQGLPARAVRVDSLAVGRTVFHGVSVMAMDWSRFPGTGAPRGVLGTRTFSELLLTFDLPAERIAIERGELPPVDSLEILPLGLSPAGIPTVPVTIGDLALEAHLDTGAPGGITLPAKFAEQLPLASTPIEVGRGRTITTELVILGAPLEGVVRLGRHTFDNPDLRFNDRIPHVNLGSEFLNRFRITLDRTNMRIRFAAAAASPPTGRGPDAVGGSRPRGRRDPDLRR